jgi:acid phosphatase type 7
MNTKYNKLNVNTSVTNKPMYRRMIIHVVALMLILTVSILPQGKSVSGAPEIQATSTITVSAEADAQVEQRDPNTNMGTSSTLEVIRSNNRNIESYIRFTVSGVSGVIQNARLRVFAITNGTKNGPALYSTANSWTENAITWNNRPARTGNVVDNKGSIQINTWVEYNVTSLVTGNGTFSFVLAGDSNDNVLFSAREGSNPSQLVITFASGINTPTRTHTPTSVATQTRTHTATSTPALTQSPVPSAATSTPTSNPTATRTPTSAPTSSDSAVLVGAGDITNCSRTQDEQTAQLLDKIPGTVFTAGDNAYVNGTYTEYLNCYDPTWGRHKSRTNPSPGNHDYLTSGAAGYFQYFNNIPSYYAYDLGAWRIYSLNSEIGVSLSSAQVAWLADDLSANPRQCVLAYWHKPRWSSGSNHGDNMNMQAIWQLLYDAGAELVLNGHEHHYERFSEMNGSGAAVSQGLREIVVGTGGASLYPFGSPKAASQVRNNNSYGVLKLTLHPNGYDWQFVPAGTATFTDTGSDTCH